MTSIYESIQEYKVQMNSGEVQTAYKRIMETIISLRTNFEKKYPDYMVPSNIYYGYMDMTYFSIIPPSLKARKLKVAVVFLHKEFRFEAWLCGVNKQVQAEYWKLFKESGWEKYRLVPTIQGEDAIVDGVLVGDPDFCDTENLTGSNRERDFHIYLKRGYLSFRKRYIAKPSPKIHPVSVQLYEAELRQARLDVVSPAPNLE